ncbi:MAG TPA: carbohydrate kinase [Candidatus Microbacterium stercoravium]|uniref:Carbohydrate kinase n=1 Tax=Candidatus Microbacterium stercoravium TaxID=2838697 RepID=A0A9D2KIP0_9MICO|nr:carbohydrate kinase [Candidatus Microbacterium stercoravium]
MPAARPASLVIGEALIDEVTLSDGSVSRTPGGSPFNVAIGLSRLGVNTGLLAHLGDDDDGSALAARLAADDVMEVGERHGTSSVAHAALAEDGSAAYDFRVAWDPRPEPAQLAREWTHVHVGSFSAFRDATLDLLAQALGGRTRPLVTFDPNIRAALIGPRDEVRRRTLELARTSHVVKLSDEDAEWLFAGRALDDVADQLLAAGPALVAVTRGGDGSVLATADERVWLTAPHADVVDTIGAGDSYMAALIAHVLRHGLPQTASDIRATGSFAQRAAAITVGRRGADPPTTAELA